MANEDEFWVVNLNTMKLVRHGSGAFTWKEFDEYLLVFPDRIALHSLAAPDPLLTVSSQHSWREISFNPQKNLYALFSPEERLVHVPPCLRRSTPSSLLSRCLSSSCPQRQCGRLCG